MSRKSKLESALAVLDGQGLLLDVPEHAVETEARETKQCTGELLLKRDPDSYAAIVVALAANKPMRWIKRTFGVGTMTVYAIQQREQEKVGTLKQRIADWCMLGAQAGASRFAELVVECGDVMAVAIATKTMAELGNLMRGQATAITEHRVITVDANELAEQMAREAQEMGFNAGENSPVAGDLPTAAPLALAADKQSAVSMGKMPICDGVSDEMETASASQIEGGGGEGRKASCPVL